MAFTVSGTAFKVSASRLDSHGFVQYVSLDRMADGKGRPVAVTGLGSAELRDLCQSVVTPTPLGPVTLRVSAGEDEPVRVENMVIDLEHMQGDVTFEDLELGRDASASRLPFVAGQTGVYSQQATRMTVRDLRQRTSSLTAGMFRLPGMRVSATFGRRECF
ncbi:DUF6230 family protein [Streptomyces lavendofoliae]|uniref:DUF6230 family protein n=1 Tax=Streptomyces lavendofoliae TaxID=67314 RepID=UPI00300EDBFF